MKQIIKKATRRILPLLLGALFVFTSVLSLTTPFLPHAIAATTPATVDQRAFLFAAYNMLLPSGSNLTCFGRFQDTISGSDVGLGNWFTPGPQTKGGTMLATDGQANCNGTDGDGSWLPTAMNLWGWTGNYSDFLKQIGYSVQGNTLVDNSQPSENQIKAAIQNKFYGGQAPKLSDAERYYTYYHDFTVGCEATQTGPWATASPDAQIADGAFKIWGVDTTSGAEVEMLYTSTTQTAARNVTIGDGVDTNPPVDELNCGDLASKLDNKALADAYAAYFKSGGKLSDSSATGGSTSGGSSDTQSPSLDCQAGWNPLNWLLCGLVNGMAIIVNQIDTLITSELAVGVPASISTSSAAPTTIFDTTSATGAAKAYYGAWNSFRNIALALMVIVGLVAIIAQALGAEILDAYTIRKIIPRFIAAALFITLSWSLMSFLVELTNALGYGIRAIIYAPFNSGGLHYQVGGGGGIALLLLSAGAITSLGIVALLSFAVTAALSVFTAFVTLVVRQILIIAMIIIAPIAIACYILPNTQKYYKMWWESFFKALLMFPIIAAIIATGHAFAAVASQNSDAISQVVAFIAYFAPYFLIPATFKFAGAALGSISGLVNKSAEGSFAGLRNFRKGRRQENTAKLRNYERFNSSNPINRGINTALGAAANPRNAIRGRKGIRAGRQSGRVNQGSESLKHDRVFAANQNDDNFLLALANRDLAEEKIAASRSKLSAAQASGDTASAASAQADITARQRGLDAAQQVKTRNYAGTRLAALSALSKTGYQFAAGEQGYQELDSTVRSIVGSDAGARAAVMDENQFHLKNAGRLDLGGINHGEKNDIKSGVRKMGNYGRGQGKTDTYFGGASEWLGSDVIGVDAAGNKTGKTLSVKDPTTGKENRAATISAMASGIDTSVSSGKTSLNDVAEWHGMLLRDKESATDANKLEIQKQIDAIESLGGAYNTGPTPSTPEELEARTNFIGSLRDNRASLMRPGIDPSELNK